MKKIILIVAIICVLMFTACQKPILCDSPYAVISNRCCIDSDKNNICDDKEGASVGMTSSKITDKGIVEKDGKQMRLILNETSEGMVKTWTDEKTTISEIYNKDGQIQEVDKKVDVGDKYLIEKRDAQGNVILSGPQPK